MHAHTAHLRTNMRWTDKSADSPSRNDRTGLGNKCAFVNSNERSAFTDNSVRSVGYTETAETECAAESPHRLVSVAQELSATSASKRVQHVSSKPSLVVDDKCLTGHTIIMVQ